MAPKRKRESEKEESNKKYTTPESGIDPGLQSSYRREAEIEPIALNTLRDLRKRTLAANEQLEDEGRILANHKIATDRALNYINKLKTLKHISLNDRISQLEEQGLHVERVAGDGNCLFRAISEQLNNARTHENLRELAVDHMRANPENFRPFMEDNVTLANYLGRMTQNATWGGNQEVRALADALHIVIHVYGQGYTQVIAPTNLAEGEHPQEIRIFHHVNHYWAVDVVDQERFAEHDQAVSQAAAQTEKEGTSFTKEVEDLMESPEKSPKSSNKPFYKLNYAESISIAEAVKQQFIKHDYHIKNVPGDGNCLFHTVSKLLPGLTHRELRDIAKEYLKSHGDDFSLWIPRREMNAAIKNLGENGEWAGVIAFQALADALGINIYIAGSYSYHILSRTNLHTTTNLLVLFDGSHYQAIIPNQQEALSSNSSSQRSEQEILSSDKMDEEDPLPSLLDSITQIDQEIDSYRAFGDAGLFIGLASLLFFMYSAYEGDV